MKQHYNITSVGQALAEMHDVLLFVNPAAYQRITEYLGSHYKTNLRIVNLKNYNRSSLGMIEPDVSTVDSDHSDSAILLANPHLKLKGLRR